MQNYPFNFYNSAQKVLNIKGNRTIAIYIDTGKIYKTYTRYPEIPSDTF